MISRGSRFEGYVGTQGIELILRYEDGEQLSPQEYQAMRAAMYLLNQHAHPSRKWDDFEWEGPEHFMRQVWPKIKKRSDISHGYIGHGGKSP